MRVDGGVVLPIFFTLSTHWLAAAISFVWKSPIFKILRDGLRENRSLLQDLSGEIVDIDSPGRYATIFSPDSVARAKNFIFSWLMGASSVVLNPFYTIVSTVAATVIIYVAARVLIDASQPIRFRSILRIVCFSGTAVLWSVIPIVGAIVAPIAVVATTSIALVQVYKIGYFKAALIATLPKLALAMGAVAGFVAFGVIFFRLIATSIGLQ
ncbi:MAG: hypothetical protein KGQ59_02780 [Bdellovibrionales bacterium]|nr:hypothetical protein [Bdellovibrionales bacterium]